MNAALLLDHTQRCQSGSGLLDCPSEVPVTELARFGAASALYRDATNRIPNGSFEIDTSPWSAGSGKAVSRSTLNSLSGFASVAISHLSGSSVTYASVTDLTLATSGAHVVSAYIWLPSDWDGTAPAVNLASFSGSTLLDSSRRAANPAIREAWQRVWEVRSIAAGDLVGNVGFFESGSLPSAGKSFFVDAVQVEQGTYPTSYLDGSLGEGYAWTGTPHASASTRAAGRLQVEGAWLDARQGGVAAYLRPAWGAADGGTHVVFERAGGDGRLRLAFEAGTWRLTSTRGAVTSSVDVAASHAWDTDVVVAAGWTPRLLLLQVDGVRAMATRSGGWPDLDDARRLDIGRRQDVESGWFDGAIGPLTVFDGPLSPRAVEVLRRMSRPPRWTDRLPGWHAA